LVQATAGAAGGARGLRGDPVRTPAGPLRGGKNSAGFFKGGGPGGEKNQGGRSGPGWGDSLVLGGVVGLGGEL